jgi:KDO2-lipid IV(A) lauroyltransferase
LFTGMARRARNRVLRCLIRVLAGVPPRVALGGMSALGAVAYRVCRTRSARARENVIRALGVGPREAARIVAGAYDSLALNAAEVLQIEGVLEQHRDDLEAVVRIEGAEHMDAAFSAGKGVLLAMAHLGAWEPLGHILARRFQPVWAVERPLDDPQLAALVDRIRGRSLAGTLDKRGSGRALLRLFQRGEVVALLLDQNAGRQGLIADFMGRPALQHKVAGVMACRYGVAVLPTYLLREGPMRFRLVFEAPVKPSPGVSEAVGVEQVTHGLARSLESQVRAHPGQWLWLHDRWRRAEWTLVRQKRKAARAAADDLSPVGASEARAKMVSSKLTEGTNDGSPSVLPVDQGP